MGKRLRMTSMILLFGVILIMTGCGSSGDTADGVGQTDNSINNTQTTVPEYQIESDVQTTAERTIVVPAVQGLQKQELFKVSEYDKYGYGTWYYGPGAIQEPRIDIMPDGYDPALVTKAKKLLNFFAMTDVHQGDKESPTQMIYLQYLYYPTPIPGMGNYPWTFETSIYSPVMMYTPFVFDAALQTANALHKKDPFDFGLGLGDAANNTQYNELRWYLDVLDGKVITPSSGAHLGADTIDYQKSFKAAGLDKSIPFYQAIGNHDQFFIGSFIVDNAQRSLRDTFTGNAPIAMGDVLLDTSNIVKTDYFMGVIDGSTLFGDIFGAGPIGNFPTPPTITADPDRYSLTKNQWIGEFFKTSSPNAYGFGLVEPNQEPDFACYSFVPKSEIPLKVIVLDDNQSQSDQSTDIHGHGFLSQARWDWLRKELDNGQSNNQLMIIACHIPIGVQPYGSKMEWWVDPQNACTIQELIIELQAHPNLIVWLSGHRHVNTIKAFKSLDQNHPENGFWQVETSSLRDFPQQFRKFEVFAESDNNVSVVATSVNPAVKEGTPAARSRHLAVATQQIIQNNMSMNYPGADPFTPGQTNPPTIPDPTIRPIDPTTYTYNATLYKQLTPKMQAVIAGIKNKSPKK